MKGTRSWGRPEWTTMTLSDWIDSAPSDWMERLVPGWQTRTYGDLLRTRPSQWWGMLYAPLTGQSAAPAAWPGAGPPGTRPAWGIGGSGHRHHPERCGCGCHEREHDCCHCGPDPCECFCCLGDVDFAVYSRVGEQRVVPLLIENERRREKAITLELSEWTTRGGHPAPVQTLLLEPKTFTLAPCGLQKVTLAVRVNPAAPAGSQAPPAERAPNERTQPPPDVDSCEVVTADLRVLGCDHRPIRIAVAILPRDCDPYRVVCGCTCC